MESLSKYPKKHEAQGVPRYFVHFFGVPLYACGGGTIPLIREWLTMGMSMSSAAAFMMTGPATKITNFGSLKIVLGVKRFLLYLAFSMAFSLVTGLSVNLVV